MPKKNKDWRNLPTEELLKLRFCDLDLKITGSLIENHIKKLYKELERKNMRFRPRIWISNEWFSPDGVGGFAIPFYLFDERLLQLEREMVFAAEGAKPDECMRLLRHETGHAIENAYRLHKNKQRKSTFGASEIPYPDEYSPRPYSRKFVVNLPGWYAQSHPDEDWAETFAVWLNPQSKWRKRYKGWPALNKLKCMNQMMKTISRKKPLLVSKSKPGDLPRLRQTLKSYYREKRNRQCLDADFYFDRDLLKIFSNDSKFNKKMSAASFIRRERRFIRQRVSKWTGQYQYTINQMIEDIIESCQEKKLRLKQSQKQTRADVIAMLTAQTSTYLTAGYDKIAM